MISVDFRNRANRFGNPLVLPAGLDTDGAGRNGGGYSLFQINFTYINLTTTFQFRDFPKFCPNI